MINNRNIEINNKILNNNLSYFEYYLSNFYNKRVSINYYFYTKPYNNTYIFGKKINYLNNIFVNIYPYNKFNNIKSLIKYYLKAINNLNYKNNINNININNLINYKKDKQLLEKLDNKLKFLENTNTNTNTNSIINTNTNTSINTNTNLIELNNTKLIELNNTKNQILLLRKYITKKLNLETLFNKNNNNNLNINNINNLSNNDLMNLVFKTIKPILSNQNILGIKLIRNGRFGSFRSRSIKSTKGISKYTFCKKTLKNINITQININNSLGLESIKLTINTTLPKNKKVN